jgi:hypothetical protein
MWGNRSTQLQVPGGTERDKTSSLHSYARPLEASVNAGIALMAAWNQLMWDQEAERFQVPG